MQFQSISGYSKRSKLDFQLWIDLLWEFEKELKVIEWRLEFVKKNKIFKILKVQVLELNKFWIPLPYELVMILFFIWIIFIFYVQFFSGEGEKIAHSNAKATIPRLFTIAIVHCSDAVHSRCHRSFRCLHTGLLFGKNMFHYNFKFLILFIESLIKIK